MLLSARTSPNETLCSRRDDAGRAHLQKNSRRLFPMLGGSRVCKLPSIPSIPRSVTFTCPDSSAVRTDSCHGESKAESHTSVANGKWCARVKPPKPSEGS